MTDPYKSRATRKSVRQSSDASDATSNGGEVNTVEEGSDKTKLLEDVEARDYSTLSGAQSTVPSQYQHSECYGEDGEANLISVSRSTAARKSGSNTPQDLDALSTEEEVRSMARRASFSFEVSLER